MTQTSDQNGSRLDRIESLVLQLATASVRHDNEMAQIRATLAEVARRQEETARQQEETARRQEEASQQISLNQEQLANLSASILDLRNLVSDYIQGRSTL